MLLQIRGDVRRLVEAGFGALTPSRARDLARSLAEGQRLEQVNKLARDLLDWSKTSRERLTDMVSREVKRQLKGLGIATRDDLDALRKRVRELETGGGAGRKSGARSSARKKSTAKRTAKKSTAKRSTSRTTSSGSSGGTSSGAPPT